MLYDVCVELLCACVAQQADSPKNGCFNLHANLPNLKARAEQVSLNILLCDGSAKKLTLTYPTNTLSYPQPLFEIDLNFDQN